MAMTLGGILSGIVISVALLQAAQAAIGAPATDTLPKHFATPRAQHNEGKSFERFRRETDAWKILDDPEIKKKIRAAMGNAEEKFWNCTQMTSAPEVEGNELVITSGVRGLFGFMESFFDLNLATGALRLGYLDDSKLHVYGTDDIQKLPRSLKDHFLALEHKEVLYDKPDFKPRATQKAPGKPERNLNLSTPTGTYQREGASRFIDSTIDVLAVPGGKIKFDIEASNGGHTGAAQGTVPILDGVAVYKEDSGFLEMRFSGKYVTITGNDQYFCGMGVTLLGKYEKANDALPKLDFR